MGFYLSSNFIPGIVVLSLGYYMTVSEGRKCSSLSNSEKSEVEYFLVAMCHRSNLKTVAVANIGSLNKCQALANLKNGMAFNYSPPGRNVFRRSSNRTSLDSCMIFSCPEIENSTSLFPDSRFDYYSAYANPIPPINSTCIEGIGVFVVHLSKENYHDSRNKCQEFGASLPDVATESRTKRLSLLLEDSLPNRGLRRAYVGMDGVDGEETLIRSNGERLTCSTFRAWAPGHPKAGGKNQSCCTLDTDRMWRLSACLTKLPFICEIFPGGWFEDYDYYQQMACRQDEGYKYN